MSGGRKIAGATPVSLTRRDLLKTTAKALVGSTAVAIVFSAAIAVAGPICGTFQVWLVAPALGQSAPAEQTSQDTRQQTADLLRRARQAMAENDLAAADSLISQAEALGVQYNPLYMGDTPKKARHDLDRKRNASAQAPTKPSQLFAPLGFGKSKAAPTTDPFAGRPADSPVVAADAGQVVPLPRVDAPNPIRPPPAAGSGADAAALGAGLSNHGAG